MNWTRPRADAAGPSTGRLVSAVLGLAGAVVLATACAGCIVGPPAASSSAPPPEVSAPYPARPIVTGIFPMSGEEVGGDIVTILGRDFSGATEVKFGKARAKKIWVNDYSRITVISPAGTGTVNVIVVTSHGSSVPSSADHFTYVALSAASLTRTTRVISAFRSINPPAGSSC